MNLQDLKAKYDSLTEKKNMITESEQLEAVKQDGYALQYCHNPSEAVCLEAVKQTGDALQYIPSALFDSLPTELTVQQVAERLGISNLKIVP